MKKFKHSIVRIFSSNFLGRYVLNTAFQLRYAGSSGYWRHRYSQRGNSGNGSYGQLATYKSDFINGFVKSHQLSSVIELGCGDGNQLGYFHFSNYIGLDVSDTAIKKCQQLFLNDPAKKFFLYLEIDRFTNTTLKADLALSLDVIYHLLEDKVYTAYMQNLFAVSNKFVVIYAWDIASKKFLHVRHRNFTAWIQQNIPHWQLKEKVAYKGESSGCDFFVYEKIATV